MSLFFVLLFVMMIFGWSMFIISVVKEKIDFVSGLIILMSSIIFIYNLRPTHSVQDNPVYLITDQNSKIKVVDRRNGKLLSFTNYPTIFYDVENDKPEHVGYSHNSFDMYYDVSLHLHKEKISKLSLNKVINVQSVSDNK